MLSILDTHLHKFRDIVKAIPLFSVIRCLHYRSVLDFGLECVLGHWIILELVIFNVNLLVTHIRV